ncbi:MAG: O-antigen ligase family protein [Chloroflexi bacterium]|nr:O-antigen ligase family protein [Chloroflexota bacterium]
MPHRPDRAAAARLAGSCVLVGLALFLAGAPLLWAAAAVIGAALLVTLCIEPASGLIALAGLIPFGRLAAMPLRGVDAVDLLVALTVAAWLAQGVARRRITFRPPPLIWPLLAFVWIAGLSLTQAGSWSEGLPEWLKWVEFAALYLAAAQILDRKRLAWMLGGLFLAGLAETALGAYQFLRQAGPEAFVLMGRFMRAYGTLQQPNPYAGYLGYLAPVAASLALGGLGQWRQQRRRADLWIGLACGGVAVLLAAGIGLSWSRGGWLGLAAALIAVAALRNRRTAILTVTALALIALVIALFGTGWLPGTVAARMADLGNYLVGPDPAQMASPVVGGTEITDANFAVLERLAHWEAGLRMFADRPWLGVGIGNYGVAYARYALPHWYDALGHAHNVYINFLAETGILGAVAFAVFWLGLAWHALRAGWQPLLAPVSDRAPRASHTSPLALDLRTSLAIGILGTLVYLSVHNIFDNLFVQHLQLQLALLMGGLAGCHPERVDPVRCAAARI